MAEIDEKTRLALRTLVRGCDYSDDVALDLAEVHLEQQLQQLADLIAALEWATEGASDGDKVRLYDNQVVCPSLDGKAPIVDHDGTGAGIAAALIRAHKEATGQ